MLRLHQEKHFDFRIETKPGEYLAPVLKVEIKPHILEWLDIHGFTHAIHRTDQNMNQYLILEVDLELCSPDAEMLFKLTWL